MRDRRSWSLLVALGSLSACGSRDSLQIPNASPAPSPAASARSADCLANLAASQLEPAQPGTLCTENPSARVGAVAIVDFKLLGLRGTSATPWYEFLPEYSRQDYYVGSASVLARGAYVAAALFAAPRQGNRATFEIALFDVEGKLLHSHRIEPADWTGGYTRNIVLTGNDRGIFAYQAGTELGLEVVTVRGERLGRMPGFIPESDPDARGVLAVRDEAAFPDFPRFWLDACTGERTPIRSSGGSIDGVGSELLYVPYSAFNPEGGIFVENAQGYRLALNFSHPTDLFQLHPSGWALISTDEPTRFLTVNVASGELREIDIELPAGFRRHRSELRATSSGGVILPLRDDRTGYLFETHDGKSWRKLGRPIGGVYRAYGAEAGGTFLHVGSDFSTEIPDWAPADDVERLDGMSIQLIRPDAKSEWLLPEHSILHQLSSDGGCVASIRGMGTQIASALSGEVSQLELRIRSVEASFTWIPGHDVYLVAP